MNISGNTDPNAAVLAPFPTGSGRYPSTCPHDCPSCCGLDVELVDNPVGEGLKVGRVHGAREHGYTAGVVCAKVARYAERVHHPDRLTVPLLQKGRKGDPGGFVPVSWDEAMDRLAGAFAEAAEKHGLESIWPYSYAGTMGLVMREGINRLRHVMGTSRQHNTICASLIGAGWMAGAGRKLGPDPRELAESDLIIVWGGNPVHTQVNLMTHISRAQKQRGAKLVVIDPYRTATAEKADLYLCIKPGTDGALACALMQVMFAEDLADRDYLARYSDDPAGLEQHLQSRTPEWAAGLTGLDPELIRTLARMIGTTPRCFIRPGYGMTRSRNGAAQIHAVASVSTVAGSWQHRGGGCLYSASGIYGIDMSLITGSDALDPGKRLLDQSRIGPILTGDARALQGGAAVHAMLIQNTNPAVVAPDQSLVRKGLAREDLFVCVHEQFMTETARMADLVLPATTFLEHSDLYIAGGHTHLSVTKPLIPPHGESRNNHELLCDLARRLGLSHPGFDMDVWALIDRTLQASGHPDAESVWQQKWLDCAVSFEEAHFLNGFGHKDGKFHFQADWDSVAVSGMGAREAKGKSWPDHLALIDGETAEKPFRLVTAPARNFLNSSFTETKTSLDKEGEPRVLMHPDSAAGLGITDGDPVRLGNERGEIIVRARLFDGIQKPVVVVESLWPNHAFPGGTGINALTGADPAGPAGGAAFHDTAIWIKPVETDRQTAPEVAAGAE